MERFNIPLEPTKYSLYQPQTHGGLSVCFEYVYAFTYIILFIIFLNDKTRNVSKLGFENHLHWKETEEGSQSNLVW